MLTTDTARRIIVATRTDGGSTATSSGATPTGGYGVGGLAPSAVLGWDEMSVSALRAYATATATGGRSSADTHALGTWVDQTTGLVHLDRTLIVADRADALARASALGEIAVWDFAAGDEIRL